MPTVEPHRPQTTKAYAYTHGTLYNAIACAHVRLSRIRACSTSEYCALQRTNHGLIPRHSALAYLASLPLHFSRVAEPLMSFITS